ncbi:hypothetical protein SDC9_166044 [bioreactor metagenome]|uniref:Uncharacterized protein n=1 Tax=bioreactor metagenome TaxID=1076179 RepID=A0A645FVX8_9ZZZZ
MATVYLVIICAMVAVIFTLGETVLHHLAIPPWLALAVLAVMFALTLIGKVRFSDKFAINLGGALPVLLSAALFTRMTRLQRTAALFLSFLGGVLIFAASEYFYDYFQDSAVRGLLCAVVALIAIKRSIVSIYAACILPAVASVADNIFFSYSGAYPSFDLFCGTWLDASAIALVLVPVLLLVFSRLFAPRSRLSL